VLETYLTLSPALRSNPLFNCSKLGVEKNVNLIECMNEWMKWNGMDWKWTLTTNGGLVRFPCKYVVVGCWANSCVQSCHLAFSFRWPAWDSFIKAILAGTAAYIKGNSFTFPPTQAPAWYTYMHVLLLYISGAAA